MCNFLLLDTIESLMQIQKIGKQETLLTEPIRHSFLNMLAYFMEPVGL